MCVCKHTYFGARTCGLFSFRTPMRQHAHSTWSPRKSPRNFPLLLLPTWGFTPPQLHRPGPSPAFFLTGAKSPAALGVTPPLFHLPFKLPAFAPLGLGHLQGL